MIMKLRRGHVAMVTVSKGRDGRHWRLSSARFMAFPDNYFILFDISIPSTRGNLKAHSVLPQRA